MDLQNPTAGTFAFGVFELDAKSGDLRRHGQKVRLPHQAFQILLLLLSRPGDVVTRDELRQALWEADTFVDFDAGLNGAVRKLREALDDAAGSPRFVETLPRRGYRFIAPVTAVERVQRAPPKAASIETSAPAPPLSAPVVTRSRRAGWIAAALLVAVAATVGTLYVRRASLIDSLGGASAVRQARADAKRPVAPEAYDAYLKGLTARGLQRFDGYQTAVSYFEQAIARQPDFAEAHAALALAQLQFLFGGPISPRDAIPKAEAAARRAIELDPTLPQAHRTLGQILSLFHWKWKEAEEEFRRAAQLLPAGDATTPGVALLRHGRFAEAISAAERARRRDPFSFAAQVDVGTAYRAAGQHDRAIVELRRALQITPGQNRALFQLGITYVLMGRFDDAVRELEAALDASQGRNPRIDAYRGYAYARAGRPLDARRVLTDLEALRREHYVSSFGIAMIHDVLGDKAEAVRAIERACDEHAVEFAQMRQYPAFTSIASEPRFLAVMQRVNLPR